MTVSARIVLVSAAASGQGKTTVTAALARRLARAGRRVRVFKTGPDFLDPMMLEAASGHPVHVLDAWMVGVDRCRALLAQAACEADAILIEGMMGLYDGQPSSADLARAFGVPVLVVVDAAAMAQTAGALVQGLRDYGPVEVAGVIANRVAGEGHARMVADALRDIPLLGYLPAQAQSLPERHLGLVQPADVNGIDVVLDALADQLVIDDAVWDAMPPVELDGSNDAGVDPSVNASEAARPLQGRTIAIAHDAAFAFLYPGNIDCLRALGAEVVYFSPVVDEPIPSGVQGVYLPGGYPELYAHVLADAQRWQASMRAAQHAGMPILAECGGLMALAETLVDAEGQRWTMPGLLPGEAVMQPRLAAIGPQAWDTAHGALRGHAFHYSQFHTVLQPFAHAVCHPHGMQGEPLYRSGSVTASYFHAYFPSCPEAVASLFRGEEPT